MEATKTPSPIGLNNQGTLSVHIFKKFRVEKAFEYGLLRAAPLFVSLDSAFLYEVTLSSDWLAFSLL